MPSNGLILSLILSASIAGTTTDDYRAALHYYKSKHYLQASKILNRLVGSELSGSPEAHYYLANCLFKINRKQRAMTEYQRVVQMSPDSVVGHYARRVIHLHTNFNKSPHQVYDEPEPQSAPAVATSKSSFDEGKFDVDMIVARLRKKLPYLPELVTNYKQGITLEEYKRTGLVEFKAGDYLRSAQAAYERASENLTKVRLATSGEIPSHRKRGETEKELRERQKRYKKAIKEILKPYEKNQQEIEDWVKEKQAILSKQVDGPQVFF